MISSHTFTYYKFSKKQCYSQVFYFEMCVPEYVFLFWSVWSRGKHSVFSVPNNIFCGGWTSVPLGESGGAKASGGLLFLIRNLSSRLFFDGGVWRAGPQSLRGGAWLAMLCFWASLWETGPGWGRVADSPDPWTWWGSNSRLLVSFSLPEPTDDSVDRVANRPEGDTEASRRNTLSFSLTPVKLSKISLSKDGPQHLLNLGHLRITNVAGT